MSELLPVVRIAAVLTFGALAGMALWHLPRAGTAGRWVAGAFGALTLALALEHVEDGLGAVLPPWLDSAGPLLILVFPYLLLRFTAAFDPLPRWMEALAGTASVVVMIGVVNALPDLSRQQWVVQLALAYWIAVSLVTVVRLWRAGQGQPTVARRRMRLMSAATAVLAVALLLAVNPPVGEETEVAVHLAALASGLLFALGFAPPRAVRLAWRRAEEEHLQQATTRLLRATDVESIAQELLAPTAAIVGAGGAAVLDASGEVVARVGDVPEDIGRSDENTPRTDHEDTYQAVPLGEGRGDLLVWTTSYTPFFGRDEVELLKSMAAVATLAFERCELLAEERTHRTVLEEARREAEQARSDAERAHGEAEQARREAEHADQAKSDFLSRMSHELRTPLNAILGFSQLLEAADLDEDDAEAAGQILKAGQHLLALIDDVLDISRIEAGTLALSPEPVDARELIDDAVALIRPHAAERPIRLEVDHSDCDVYVTTDHQRCRQVLLNLLSNAVKYNCDEGEVRLSCDRTSDGMLRIAVADTGPGIDPARQAQLFEPFERLGAESSDVQGTGLGLALSRRLVERLGGRIGLESDPPNGSTFWIDLPVTETPPAELEPAADYAEPASTGVRTLLLVEDNLANLRFVEAMLERFRPNLSVLPAMQGGIAVDLATQHHPAIVLLDLHLPDIPGRHVLTRLKSDQRTRDIPVVITSAEARPSHVSQLRTEGAFDYVTKPFDVQAILSVIDAALAHGPEEDTAGSGGWSRGDSNP